MNLRQQILKENSKANCMFIVNWVGDSQTRFDELFKLFVTDVYRVVQLSSWPVSYCVEAHPALIKKHFKTLVKKLEEPDAQDAVKRNAVRLLQHVSIPAQFQGAIMNACFNFIVDPQEKAALKAFSLTVLEHLAVDYPEILPEIKTIINERWDQETPAFHSRALRILKAKS